MKTIRQAIHDSHVPAPLIRAVIKQLGGWKDAQLILPEVVLHGAVGGFSGFIYYHETCKFYERNRESIVTLVETTAQDLGCDPFEFVKNSQCSYIEDLKPRTIYRALYGIQDDTTLEVVNALAWFALEEVARAFED